MDRGIIRIRTIFLTGVIAALFMGGGCSDPVPVPEVSSNVATQVEQKRQEERTPAEPVKQALDDYSSEVGDGSRPEPPQSSDNAPSVPSEPDRPSRNSANIPRGERVVVERCVDGDTLIVRSSAGRERVRLVGANTPETVKPDSPVEPFGPEASAYTKRRVSEANNVAYLVTDGPSHDQYGRRLAVVYLGNDTISLDEDLVRHGLAIATLKYDYSQEMKDKLSAAQRAAKSEGLGIHSLNK